MAVLSLSNLKKAWYYLQKNGPGAAYLAALERILESRQAPYVYEPVPEETLQKQKSSHVSDILFSVVVPAYETRQEHLNALLDSLASQTYRNWELVLADASPNSSVKETLEAWKMGHPEQGSAICYLKLDKNGGIAENTNAGIAQACGDYIGLLDHDDLLTPDALYEVAEAIEREKKAGRQPQVLYSDEDKCDGTAAAFYEPHFKMDFNPDLLLSNNYICHFLVMESGLMKRLKLRADFDGAQDYDLVLRAAGNRAHFVHVPKVLYHWRCHNASTAANPRSKAHAYEAGKRAVEDFCQNAGWKVTVSHLKHLGFYRADYEEDIFSQRPEIGAVAIPLEDRKRLRSGIYDQNGRMLFEGLRKGFSGPMHRAALQQDVDSADLRTLKVRSQLQPLYKEAMQRIAGADEEKIRKESIRFCTELRDAGYLILWDPQAGGSGPKGNGQR